MSHTTCRIADDQVDLRALGALLVNSGAIALAVIRHERIMFATPAFHAMFHASGSLAGIMLPDIVTDSGGERLADALTAAEHGATRFTGLGHRGGEPVFDLILDLELADLGGEPAVLAFASDVTEQYRSRERLTYLAFADVLTGLPNRASFTDRLHQMMLGSRRHAMRFAVLMADLDGFKGVNDTFGHAAGDVVLREVGQRFRGCIRDTDTLARLGGDEFAVILARTDNTEAAALVALRLIRTLEEPIHLGAQRVVVGTSIGIAVYPEHARSRDLLLRAADTALYRAKRMGRNTFQWAGSEADVEPPPVAPQIWTTAHSVGIREIDEQHAHLAGLIDRLAAALHDGAQREDIEERLSQTIDYTAKHFAAEERLMAEHEIADADQHREAHCRLLDDIRNLGLDGELPSISLIQRYLQEWLMRHVDGMDKALGRALLAQGRR